MNNGKLNGKVALVTGGTSGIGKTTAIEFARAGAKVVLTGRREKEGAQVLDEIRKLGGDAAFVRADVAKQNIRINAVAPGVIATDMLDRFAGKEGEMRDSLASITQSDGLAPWKKSQRLFSIFVPTTRNSPPGRHRS